MSNPPSNSPPQQNQNPGQRSRQVAPPLTAEEKRVLKECGSESFWYRCVPVSVAFMGLVEANIARAARMGHANPRAGVLFKHMGACLVGLIFGKMLYADKCKEKIMQLPNSPLAEALRKGSGGYQDLAAGMSMPYQTETSSDEHSQVSPAQNRGLPEFQRSQDLDTTSNIQHKGLDDAYKPSLDREEKLPQPSVGMQSGYVSYDDLRRQNREEYQRTVSGSKTPSSPKLSISSSSGNYEKSKPVVRRNQWGDVIEE